ncbi:GGDEF domain-containing protein [Terriglobus roseus]|uniref:diguanylate cyclase n=1 Tax=Terriglobus roseus TaxID=392734 RepID=A0A1H4R9B5_9BACT|nr:GGDEF domain-containing protein [Terriglobus roseus]SEC28398.1 diguanylate cyclase (GGDEF) domain-containing protein [Terriglobus roseus]
MISVLHRIEDLQVVCFAIIFSVMAWQMRKNKTIRYAWLSYVLASVVSVLDVAMPQPLSTLTVSCIFAIISIRYAILASAMSAFTRRSRWLAMVSYGVAALSASLLLLPRAGVAPFVISGLFYLFLAVQLSLMCVIVLLSKEKATRVPRRFIGVLFLLSVACRFAQTWAVWSHASARAAWWRDQGLFLNSTVIGCVLPFTIVWMMNARIQKDLLKQSLVDPLTELLNRRGLNDAAQRELSRYARVRQDFAVAVVDIDHFKTLNDSYGHACGDDVLRSTASLFRELLRQSDVVSRSGGEEFVLLLALTQESETLAVLERIRSAVAARTLQVGDATVQTTISIGATNTRGRFNLTWRELHDEADQALYAAKRGGRNRTALFDAQDTGASHGPEQGAVDVQSVA